jgi:hypothetical protein
MKKIWGFKLERFKAFFSKHLKQNITVLGYEIKLFSHYFVVFGVQSNLVSHQLAHPKPFRLFRTNLK